MNNFTNLKGKINRRTKNRRLTKLTSKANGLTINRKQIIIMIPSNTEYKRNDFKLDKVPKKMCHAGRVNFIGNQDRK